MFTNDRGIRRKNDFTNALRKKKKSDWFEPAAYDGLVKCRNKPLYALPGFMERRSWYNSIHQYSKNKVHCSCPDCSAKSGVNNSIHNYTISDQRKLEKMRYGLIEVC